MKDNNKKSYKKEKNEAIETLRENILKYGAVDSDYIIWPVYNCAFIIGYLQFFIDYADFDNNSALKSPFLSYDNIAKKFYQDFDEQFKALYLRSGYVIAVQWLVETIEFCVTLYYNTEIRYDAYFSINEEA